MMGISKATAKDIMQKDVVTLSPDMSLMQAHELLSQRKISGAPVVDEQRKVVGVLSTTDLIKQSYKTEFDEFPPNIFYVGIPFSDSPGFQEIPQQLQVIKVSEVMHEQVISAQPDDTVDYLALTMRGKAIHRLIILEDDTLCGIVTTFDLLRLLENH